MEERLHIAEKGRKKNVPCKDGGCDRNRAQSLANSSESRKPEHGCVYVSAGPYGNSKEINSEARKEKRNPTKKTATMQNGKHKNKSRNKIETT
jgi:hypothetical protein